MIRLVVQLDRRRAIHPRRHALERERDLALELALAGGQLVFRNAVVGQQAQLRADRVGRRVGRLRARSRRTRRARRRRRETTGSVYTA